MPELPGSLHHLGSDFAQIPAVGELVCGKYRIDGVLGSGGMGVVLAARNVAIDQPVAIKFIAIGDEEKRSEAALRLMREARAAAALNNEHVVRVYDVGESESGLPFIVMERLEGMDLAQVARKGGALPIPAAVCFVRQACAALSEAHRAYIVHRDLKPSNLFLVRRLDGTAAIKILDFGIAKSMARGPDKADSSTLTGAREALGSPHYMSPEQVRDARSVDTRADIWSLGAILFELIAGRPAFQATTHPGVYAAIVSDSPPTLNSLRAEVPEALALVVARCLERNLDQRFQTVEELSRALEPFAGASVQFDTLPKPESMAVSHLTLTESGSRRALHELTASLPRSSSESDLLALGAASTERAPSISEMASSIDELAPATERSPTSTDSSFAVVPRQPRSYRREVLTLLGMVGVASLAYWVLRRPTTPADESGPVAVQLAVESVPNGAQVFDRGQALGVTPLTIQLSFASKAASPRALRLVLDGYKDFVFEQGPETQERQLRALLERLPSSPTASHLPGRAEPSASQPAPTQAGSAEPAASAAAQADDPNPVSQGKPEAAPKASATVNLKALPAASQSSTRGPAAPAASNGTRPSTAAEDARPEIRTRR